MGKRSDFVRRERDFYPTPKEAVLPLVQHLPQGDMLYWEPCAGAGDLDRHIVSFGLDQGHTWLPEMSTDIESRDKYVFHGDAFSFDRLPAEVSYIITNPPWDRKVLHPMIEHFSDMRPTWLLFDADWVHTKQSAPFVGRLCKIVSVGRVKWIPDSKMTGKDNCAWHLFDKNHSGPTQFHGRLS